MTTPEERDDERDLAAFKKRKGLPRGFIVSLITLLLVFFMILGVCYRG